MERDRCRPAHEADLVLAYAEGEGYRGVRLPYKGDAADVLVMLFEEGRFDEIEGRLRADLPGEAKTETRPYRCVGPTMPRFAFETELDLIPLLRPMGVTIPCEGGAADFGGITREGTLSVGDARHKANVTVDEKGTEAAAARALDMPVRGPRPVVEMTINRPFFFAITERETGTTLFLGRVRGPS